MEFKLEYIQDKVEFFEAYDLKTLEKKIDEQIENNKVLMLEVHSVTHHVAFQPDSGRPLYTAVVHFKSKNRQ
jgi:hypothetical protein